MKRHGAVYHVTARANRGEFIMNASRIKEMFLEVLHRAKIKYGFVLKHFCVMDNHVHLLLKPTGNTNLSRIMQWILSVFATKFNRLFGFHGHVWYDRFKSKIIESMGQFFNTFNYISNNPVKAGIVEDCIAYKYGGLNFLKHPCSGLIDLPDSLIKMLFPDIKLKKNSEG